MPKALLLAFERGYNALPGVLVQDITSWGEIKQVYRELKKPEVKDFYKSIIIDTIDIAAEMCQKYICTQNGISSLGELGYGKGWTAFKEQFASVFRGLTQLGYAVFFIGHDKEVISDDGKTKIIRPALTQTTKTIISGMADIIGYAHQEKGYPQSVLTIRCPDDTIECGSRFKYIASEFPMNYDNLVEAVKNAIEKEADENNHKFITDEKQTVTEAKTYNYDELMNEFQSIVEKLMEKDAGNAPKITSVIEHYLGKGKKASEITPYQAEFLYLINEDLKSL